MKNPFVNLFSTNKNDTNKKQHKLLDNFSQFQRAINELFEAIKETSIKNLMERYSSFCDELIFKTIEDNPKWTFAGGQFILQLDETEKYVDLDFQFYFLNEEEKWIKKNIYNRMSIYQFDEESKNMILEDKIIKFEINEP